MNLTVLRNDADVPPGLLVDVATGRGIDIDLVALDAGDPLPDPGAVEAVVVLGGEMGVYDTDRHPYLTAEAGFLRSIVEGGIPVLGLCLGCQLLASALGGAAYRADRPEVAFTRLDVLVDDPVVGILSVDRSLTIHRDTWDLPPGGVLVARSPRYRQAFRFGSALGIQPHVEVTEDIVRSWVLTPGGSKLVEQAGRVTEEVLAEFHDGAQGVVATAERLFSAWFDEATHRRDGGST
jgi:GMP synthase (glutamine-hydrolysing)